MGTRKLVLDGSSWRRTSATSFETLIFVAGWKDCSRLTNLETLRKRVEGSG